jgi:hypothetical protein
LRKISKVQSGQTSGIVCSRNKKNDDFLLATYESLRKGGGNACGSRNKREERPLNKLTASNVREAIHCCDQRCMARHDSTKSNQTSWPRNERSDSTHRKISKEDAFLS